jgi:hypothetical protein
MDDVRILCNTCHEKLHSILGYKRIGNYDIEILQDEQKVQPSNPIEKMLLKIGLNY